MSILLQTPKEVMQNVAKRVKALRLAQNLSQEGLALRSSLSTGTIKRFEKTGQISLQSLIDIALALGVMNEFENIFVIKDKPTSLFEKQPNTTTRKRGIKK